MGLLTTEFGPYQLAKCRCVDSLFLMAGNVYASNCLGAMDRKRNELKTGSQGGRRTVSDAYVHGVWNGGIRPHDRMRVCSTFSRGSC